MRSGSRLSSRWSAASRQWRTGIEAALIVVVIAIVGVLVFAPQSDRFCNAHKVGCSLLTGFLGTGIVVLAGYFFLFVWTFRRARRYYLSIAQTSPERVMPAPPRLRADAIVGRQRLVRTVADEAAFSKNGVPVLVVGQAGSGKTTFLLALTQHLARAGAVPVVVSLRGAPLPLSFRKLAEEELLRRIDSVVRIEADAKRVWRRFCADGDIVVLVDSLDDVALGLPRRERDHVIRAALVTATNDRVAVIATARPETVPSAAPASQFELGPLDVDDALQYLERRVSVRSEADRKRLREIIANGHVAQSPLYLNVISAIYRTGALPQSPRQRDALLVDLLDSWIGLLESGELLPEVEFEPWQRRRIIEGLEVIAYAMTLDSLMETRISRLDEALRALAPSGAGGAIETSLAVEGANQLDLIDTFVFEDDIGIRFKHAVIQSYFASRHLWHQPSAWARLVKELGLEALEPVLMWSSRATDASADTAAKALLDRARSLDEDSALAFVITAQELAVVPGSPSGAERAAAAVMDIWKRATPRGRLAAIRRLDERRGAWTYRTLYRATRDPSYRVRWAASRTIAAGGDEAFVELEGDFSETVEYACSRPWREWDDSKTHDISVLGWIMPPLAGRVEGAAGERVKAQLQRLTELVPDRMPLGTEASIAQGFKLSAVMGPPAFPSQAAAELMRRCTFWYSRIVLLHALGVSCIRSSDGRAAMRSIHDRLADDGEHPLVREAARLCLRAIKGNDWFPYVWEDESALIGQSGSVLADETGVLLADLVILLNLTEQGMSKEEIEARKDATYRRNDLPYCLSGSRDRSQQLFGRCDKRCTFALCPYPPRADFAVARGEFTEAFCEHQIELIAGRRGLRVWDRRKPPGSWSHTSRMSRRRFWEAMASRAL